MNKYSIDHIKIVMSKKGYKFFGTHKPYNVNLIGVRMKTDKINLFDDLFYNIHSNDKRQLVIMEHKFTTDPGKYWLNNPMNTDGCAILVPGQYRGFWALGLHRGQYEALVQVGNGKFYRDNNKDDVLDFNPESIQTGKIGCNNHRSNPKSQSYYVDKWSAACQVHAMVSEYKKHIAVCENAAKLYGNSFTYTLLEQKDFEG